jgi:hypothetical protein
LPWMLGMPSILNKGRAVKRKAVLTQANGDVVDEDHLTETAPTRQVQLVASNREEAYPDSRQRIKPFKLTYTIPLHALVSGDMQPKPCTGVPCDRGATL